MSQEEVIETESVGTSLGSIFDGVDWQVIGPKLIIAAAIVLVVMWLCVMILRFLSPLLIFLVAFAAVSVVGYLIITGQVVSEWQIGYACAVTGIIAAVVALPAITAKKK